MYSAWCCFIFIVLATTTAALLTDAKGTENPKPSNSTTSPSTPTATVQFSDDSEDNVNVGGPRKRTIEQTVGYGYRYNTVLRPVSAAGDVVASVSRNRQTYQPMASRPTPASYYFQQQVETTSPKPVHRFNVPFTTYPRYTRPESTETRPVTENPISATSTAPLQPHQGVYREVFTFDEAVPSPYHIAPRAEAPAQISPAQISPAQILPQALLLAPAGHHSPGHQQLIPVLILRLDTAAPFPYPMMAMQILREDTARMYAPQDPAAQLQHYVDPAPNEAPALTYYMPASAHAHVHEPPRVQTMTATQQERYREQDPNLSKVPVRRPSSAGNGVSQGTRTEVTIHHSPGMTAQDYKESVEQEEAA